MLMGSVEHLAEIHEFICMANSIIPKESKGLLPSDLASRLVFVIQWTNWEFSGCSNNSAKTKEAIKGTLSLDVWNLLELAL